MSQSDNKPMSESRYEQILWVDARSDDGWIDPNDLDVRLASIATVGRVIYDTDDVLCVASSEDSRTRQLSSVMYIPKKCIVKRIPLPFGDNSEVLEMLRKVLNEVGHICKSDDVCVICQAKALLTRLSN